MLVVTTSSSGLGAKCCLKVTNTPMSWFLDRNNPCPTELVSAPFSTPPPAHPSPLLPLLALESETLKEGSPRSVNGSPLPGGRGDLSQLDGAHSGQLSRTRSGAAARSPERLAGSQAHSGMLGALPVPRPQGLWAIVKEVSSSSAGLGPLNATKALAAQSSPQKGLKQWGVGFILAPGLRGAAREGQDGAGSSKAWWVS